MAKNDNITGQLLIGNHWQQGNGEPFQKSNPISAKVIWQGNEASSDDVKQACKAARQAFLTWAKTDLDDRIALVQQFANVLKQNKDQLADVIGQETSKPLWESKTEVEAMIGKVEISIKAYHDRTGSYESELNGDISSLRHRPHGVLAVFGPYNFPGHLPNGHIVPAVIAGNAIVFKPSEQTPKTAELTVKLWQQAGLPAGVINLVQGGRSVGEALAGNALIDGLLFTGSAGVGQILSEQFAKTPQKILALEMGGNNALIIDDFDDIEAAVNLAIQSAFISAGQRCTCARRILVKEGGKGDKFIDRLVQVAKNLTIGAYDASPEPFMGGVISPQAAQKIVDAEQALQELGAVSLLKMHWQDKNSSLLTPAILDVTGLDVPDEEYFGPLTTIRRYQTFDDAITLANDTRFGLSCSLVSPERALFERLLIEGRAGIINWNKPTTGAASSVPFGGVGVSGNHRPSAYYAADYCAYPVSSLQNSKLSLPSKLSPGIDLQVGQ